MDITEKLARERSEYVSLSVGLKWLFKKSNNLKYGEDLHSPL